MTLVALTVDEKGSVKNPVVVRSGGKDVDEKAMEAVRQWRFSPATCGKDPIEVKIQVEVEVAAQLR